MNRPRLLLVTGPPGSGKTTLVAALAKLPQFRWHRSITTRRPRPGATSPEYEHVSDAEFAAFEAAGAFLEVNPDSQSVRYGFPRPEPVPEIILVGISSRDGVRAIRLALKDWDVLVICLDAPNEVLSARMTSRGDSRAEVQCRAAILAREREALEEADFRAPWISRDETLAAVRAELRTRSWIPLEAIFAEIQTRSTLCQAERSSDNP